jgi:hypothetical protein
MTAAGRARCDAVRLIDRTIDQIRADQAGGLLHEWLGDENPPAQCGVARIGECEIGFHRGIAVPRGQDAKIIREILDRDLGAQPVETELVGKVLRQRARAIDQEATGAIAGLRDQEIRYDLALRRQQRAEPAEARPQQRHIRRDEAVEKVAGIGAADLDHAPVGKKRCFHAKISCECCSGT